MIPGTDCYLNRSMIRQSLIPCIFHLNLLFFDGIRKYYVNVGILLVRSSFPRPILRFMADPSLRLNELFKFPEALASDIRVNVNVDYFGTVILLLCLLKKCSDFISFGILLVVLAMHRSYCNVL